MIGQKSKALNSQCAQITSKASRPSKCPLGVLLAPSVKEKANLTRVFPHERPMQNTFPHSIECYEAPSGVVQSGDAEGTLLGPFRHALPQRPPQSLSVVAETGSSRDCGALELLLRAQAYPRVFSDALVLGWVFPHSCQRLVPYLELGAGNPRA